MHAGVYTVEDLRMQEKIRLEIHDCRRRLMQERKISLGSIHRIYDRENYPTLQLYIKHSSTYYHSLILKIHSFFYKNVLSPDLR